MEKICIYCSLRPKKAREHVINREFFLAGHRGRLPQVSACTECNSEKSEIENYINTILPLAGRHRSATENMIELVPKRLSGNKHLAKKVMSGLTPVLDHVDGKWLQTASIPFDGTVLNQWLVWVTRGLNFYLSKIRLDQEEDGVTVVFIKPADRYILDRFLQGERCINKNYGEGTFSIAMNTFADNRRSALWRFEILGGMKFNDGFATPYAISGPSSSRVFLRQWSNYHEENYPFAPILELDQARLER